MYEVIGNDRRCLHCLPGTDNPARQCSLVRRRFLASVYGHCRNAHSGPSVASNPCIDVLAVQAAGVDWSNFLRVVPLALAGSRLCLWQIHTTVKQADSRSYNSCVSYCGPFLLSDREAVPDLEETLQSCLSKAVERSDLNNPPTAEAVNKLKNVVGKYPQRQLGDFSVRPTTDTPLRNRESHTRKCVDCSDPDNNR